MRWNTYWQTKLPKRVHRPDMQAFPNQFANFRCNRLPQSGGTPWDWRAGESLFVVISHYSTSIFRIMLPNEGEKHFLEKATNKIGKRGV